MNEIGLGYVKIQHLVKSEDLGVYFILFISLGCILEQKYLH